MKRFLLLLFLCSFNLSVFASCPINGDACTVSNWDEKPLQEKYVPENLRELEKTDAFQPEFVVPYHDALINTESSAIKTSPQGNYNSNCQFGVCLPGAEQEGEIIE